MIAPNTIDEFFDTLYEKKDGKYIWKCKNDKGYLTENCWEDTYFGKYTELKTISDLMDIYEEQIAGKPIIHTIYREFRILVKEENTNSLSVYDMNVGTLDYYIFHVKNKEISV
jgi:hypothetical protein